MDKIIYFGSSQFSKTILNGLLKAQIRPILVVTKPDAPGGRGLKLCPTQVSEISKNYNIETIKPKSLKTAEILEKISKAKPNYLVIADYGKIIPDSLLTIPKILPLGVHPSLLPLYRGPAPIERALINGDKTSGVTIFKLDQGVDSGPVILQKKIKIDENDNYFTFSKKLATQGVEALIETLYQIKNQSLKLTPQDEKKAAFAPKLSKKDGKINWLSSAEKISNLIRATLNWPTAYTYYQNKMLKITEAESLKEESGQKPATVIKIDKSGFCVAAGSGVLKVKKVKPAGKKEMPSWSFACGHRIKEGDAFESGLSV